MDSLANIRQQIDIVEELSAQHRYVRQRVKLARHHFVYDQGYARQRKARKQIRHYSKQRNKLQPQLQEAINQLARMIDVTTTYTETDLLRQAKQLLLQPTAATHPGLQVLLRPRNSKR